MAHSHVVYYPTRYEGFGLPAIEAMALGIPLISGKTTSLIEVVGDAGILVNPDSRHDLSDALRAAAHDSTLRSRLTEQGCERSHLFSRSRLADGMMSMFHEFADRR
jgi:glycosyltransferase involved in cell wall biosynthesis